MKITEDQLQQIIEMYLVDKVSTTYIGRKFNISPTTVTSYLRKRGVRIQKARFKFNELYFEKIDTPNKAYFLGLIYADGCINTKFTCTIKLVSSDSYILDKLNNEIECIKPLIQIKEEIIKGTKYIGKARSILQINSKKLVSDLNNLGVYSNKSQIITFPSNDLVPEILKWDFIRGYFDGDGCIHTPEGKPYINFAGNEEFLIELSNFINKHIGINPKPFKHRSASCYYIRISKLDKVLKFCEKIYNNENSSKLMRKYKIYNDYLSGPHYNKIKSYLEKRGTIHGINKYTKL